MYFNRCVFVFHSSIELVVEVLLCVRRERDESNINDVVLDVEFLNESRQPTLDVVEIGRFHTSTRVEQEDDVSRVAAGWNATTH